ncbi:hypothetical protein SERLA73DRAFT_181074 [Serpula lacrymans var. lacrymans S7.3]|uniref:Uncharacterized protein n=2 Tax=Serpula lacrymans var. lacrymans TaxID=341189 RepID=F8PUR0_SERL3|nr:uncharacterized protein SERLADRAFT_466951 [Serpula lacrymans var. lacrymans S7.9]EGO00468.1 hypothetical protein SERLA73DRAFT_181074 [Serpula lacrymans var. lacrymans S7.3]EGO26019.1 hypothetical protein SERLADRAFT_466951 [Serpula lacrymans var. lacrymans S7.9]
MILILLTIVLPSFSVHCPYQSPQSWIFFVIVKPLRIFFSPTSLRLPFKNSPKTTTSTPPTGSPPLKNWRERDLAIAERFGDELDVQILEIADQHFMNEDFLGNVVRPCIARALFLQYHGLPRMLFGQDDREC